LKKSAVSATQLAKCILLHPYSHTMQLPESQLHEHKQNLHAANLTSWHNSIFGYKLKTIEAENP